MRKLTDEAVLSIPGLILDGLTLKEIAQTLGVANSALGLILAAKTYKHIQATLQPKLVEARRKLAEPPTAKACSKCKKILPRTKEYFQTINRKPGFEARCLTCKSEQNTSRYAATKLRVMQHYSEGDPRCACCYESRLEFLSIDHINGGGNKHRKELARHYVGIYQWLEKSSYPSGFRVLCMNCNTAIGFYGYCPHQRQ